MRTLLILIAIAGLVFGWWHSALRQRQAVAALQKSNPSASIYYDYEIDARGDLVDGALRGGFTDPRCVDYFFKPAFVEMTYATDADMACLARLSGLRRVVLERSIDLTDGGLRSLAELIHLRRLSILHGDRITDAGLRHLESLASLEELRLNVDMRRVTPEAIERLQRALPNCRIDLFARPRGDDGDDNPLS